jgi:hypothetical protein
MQSFDFLFKSYCQFFSFRLLKDLFKPLFKFLDFIRYFRIQSNFLDQIKFR